MVWNARWPKLIAVTHPHELVVDDLDGVSFLNIRDRNKRFHIARSSPGRRVRYPSVTGDSAFL